MFIPRSFSGRTADSESVSGGSNPSRGSIFWRGLLIGLGNQTFNLSNAGSSPVRATIAKSVHAAADEEDFSVLG